MNITQVIQGVHNPSAGPTYSVARLADELFAMGEDSSVLTLGARPGSWQHRAPLVIHEGIFETKTGMSLSLMKDIRNLSRQPCIIHGHGIWRLVNLFPLFLERESPARIVCSPRGMLSPWSMQYKSLIKRPIWKYLQKHALDRCHCFHATATVEYDDIRRQRLTAPVCIVPNGVDVPKLPKHPARSKKVVFLSRIDPKKGLDILLPAWSSIAADFRDWELIIAGPLTGNYARTVQALAKTLNAPRVTFVGEVLGNAKQALLTDASLFVLPTYSENFGIAVAEALAHGTPVITTTETPWSEVVDRRCGWCIRPDENVLRDTLRQALTLSLPALHEMGLRGNRWMEQNYAWPHIAGMMKQTYEWLTKGGKRPDWVIE